MAVAHPCHAKIESTAGNGRVLRALIEERRELFDGLDQHPERFAGSCAAIRQ
jgi:hypothetical protein